MAFLQSFGKAEDAQTCATYLSSCDIDATVIDDMAFGGNMLGLSNPGSIRIEVPDEQLAEARALLAALPPASVAVTAPAAAQGVWDAGALGRFFRALLVVEAAFIAIFALYGEFANPEPPPAVTDFLRGLAFSDWLWTLSYVSFWPLNVVALVANVLCFFYSRFGRSLYVATVIWSLIITLGPPPMILEPWANFMGSLQSSIGYIALALMFWSPLCSRFDPEC